MAIRKELGVQKLQDSEELTTAYLELLEKLEPLIHKSGLAAAVYTQTTDVEIEINGLLTYDREVLKIPQEKLAPANRKISDSLQQLKAVQP